MKILCDSALRRAALVILPVAACGLGLKAGRLFAHVPALPLWQDALFLAPDFLFFAGLCALATAALALGVTLGIVAVQLLALMVFLIDVFAFGYFRATGTALDAATIAESLRHALDTAPIVGSEIGWGTGLLLLVMPLWIAVVPWLRRLSRAGPWKPGRGSALALVAAGLLLFGLSHAVVVPRVPASVVHDPVLHVVAGVLGPARPALFASSPRALPRHVGPRRVARSETTRALNVVIVVLESTRADATTAYAPRLDTTPALARLARTGTRVERAYATVPHTSKALVAILCGIDPQQSIEILEADERGLPGVCLPRLLGDVGYDSTFFQAPHGDFERRQKLARGMGFDRFFSGDRMPAEGFEKINYFGYEDAIVLGPSERWLRTEAREPFLAVYLSSATHHPYRVPSTFASRTFSTAEWNPYLNAVRYTDDVLAKILAQYETAGLFERTLFVVVGDHGEAFGEHNLSKHDDVMYEEGLRVPLVLRAPAAAGLPATLAGPVSQLDLAPTILSILGLRSEGGAWEGRELFRPGLATVPLYAACFRNPHCLATIRGNYKLIHNFQDRPAELFDVVADPAERTNLAAQYPELVAAWTPELLAWASAVHEMYASRTAETLARYVRSTPPPTFAGAALGRFGSLLELLDCNGRRKGRGNMEVSCDLHVLAPLDDGYRLRVRAAAAAGADVEHQVFDHKPVSGLYPLRDWKPGDYINDNFNVFAPPHWEERTVTLCLEVQDDAGVPLAVTPAPSTGDPCLPFAVLPPRAPAQEAREDGAFSSTRR